MKYELEKFIGKKVKIQLNDGDVYIGNVDDISDAEDNERPYKTIEIWVEDIGGRFFYEDEIKKIQEIEEQK